MARRSDHSKDELNRLVIAEGRKIIADGGKEALSARRLADRIGYTVGTLYQHFRNIDDIVEQINSATLNELAERIAGVGETGQASHRLHLLADAMCGFLEENGNLWDAVVSYKFAVDHERSEQYTANVGRLYGQIETAILPLYAEAEIGLLKTDMRLLWASLHGIFIVVRADRVGDETIRSLMQRAVDNFLAARGSTSAK